MTRLQSIGICWILLQSGYANTVQVSTWDDLNPSINGGTLAVAESVTISRDFTVESSGATFDTASGAALTIDGTVKGADGATLTLTGDGTTILSAVANSGTFTIAGPIGGAGNLSKSGRGALVLTGNSSSYTGNLQVVAGELKVNGALSSSSEVTLFTYTTLSGTGSVGAIMCSGTVSPGNSVETLSSGPVVFNSGSVFEVKINGSAASSLNAAGTAALAGSVTVVQDASDSYPRQASYPILTATDGISGAFSSTVLGGLPTYIFRLSQMGDTLYLFYNFVSIPLTNLSGNGLKTANYLNQNGDVPAILLLDSLSGSALQEALNGVSPARNAFGAYIAAQTAFSFSNLVVNHMDSFRFLGREEAKGDFTAALVADASCQAVSGQKSGDRFAGWVSGFGEFSHVAASMENPSFNFISGAVLAGLDFRGENKGLIGGALGYAHSHFDEEQNAGHGNINFYIASAYGNFRNSAFYFSPSVWGIFNQTDQIRHIAFPGFLANAKADIFAWQLVPHGEAGYEFAWFGKVIPFTSLDWAISWQRGYTEHGATPYNAVQKGHTSSMMRSETGLKLCQQWEQSWGLFSLREKASYIFEKPFGVGTVHASFVGATGAFTVAAVDQILNLGAIGLDFLFVVGDDRSVAIDLDYEGEFGAHYWSNQGMLSLSKSF